MVGTNDYFAGRRSPPGWTNSGAFTRKKIASARYSVEEASIPGLIVTGFIIAMHYRPVEKISTLDFAVRKIYTNDL